MKLAIVGSRSFEENQENLEYVIEKVDHFFDLDKISTIISGGADGADALAEDFYDYLIDEGFDVDKDIELPAYQKFDHIDYHVNQYFERNQKIAEKCDAMIAFWDGESSGTDDAIEQAQLLNKTVKVVYVE
jgi:hypothetical protein